MTHTDIDIEPATMANTPPNIMTTRAESPPIAGSSSPPAPLPAATSRHPPCNARWSTPSLADARCPTLGNCRPTFRPKHCTLREPSEHKSHALHSVGHSGRIRKRPFTAHFPTRPGRVLHEPRSGYGRPTLPALVGVSRASNDVRRGFPCAKLGRRCPDSGQRPADEHNQTSRHLAGISSWLGGKGLIRLGFGSRMMSIVARSTGISAEAGRAEFGSRTSLNFQAWEWERRF